MQVIVIILGMHKSGTTLAAKTLHESGIYMGSMSTGDYPKTKYEDPEALAITKWILYNSDKRHSLDLPHPLWEKEIDEVLITRMKKMIALRQREHKDSWGFKVPDATLCYDLWKEHLPEHIAIGVKRSRDGLINHYTRGKTKHSINKINQVCDLYESTLDGYNIPVIKFEDFLERGPVVLEEILGVKLVDCRRSK